MRIVASVICSTQLTKQKLSDSTLVVVVGDHGEAFGQHRRNFAHASEIYEENMHVPLAFITRGSSTVRPATESAG